MNKFQFTQFDDLLPDSTFGRPYLTREQLCQKLAARAQNDAARIAGNLHMSQRYMEEMEDFVLHHCAGKLVNTPFDFPWLKGCTPEKRFMEQIAYIIGTPDTLPHLLDMIDNGEPPHLLDDTDRAKIGEILDWYNNQSTYTERKHTPFDYEKVLQCVELMDFADLLEDENNNSNKTWVNGLMQAIFDNVSLSEMQRRNMALSIGYTDERKRKKAIKDYAKFRSE